VCVQFPGGRFIVRMPGGDTQGPAVAPGEWYRVRFVYDGAGAYLRVSHGWLDQRGREIHPDAAAGPLQLFISGCGLCLYGVIG
jgi:hypothetical protein